MRRMNDLHQQGSELDGAVKENPPALLRDLLQHPVMKAALPTGELSPVNSGVDDEGWRSRSSGLDEHVVSSQMFEPSECEGLFCYN